MFVSGSRKFVLAKISRYTVCQNFFTSRSLRRLEREKYSSTAVRALQNVQLWFKVKVYLFLSLAASKIFRILAAQADKHGRLQPDQREEKVILYTMSRFTTVIVLLANHQCHVPGHVD